MGKVLAEVSYIGEDLEDALADLADEAGHNLVVDWPALEAIGIYSDTRIDLSLQDVTASAAFTAVLKVADQRHLGATFTIRDGLLNVTTKAVLNRQFEVRTYDCAALLQTESNVRSSSPIGPIGPWRPHRHISALRWHRHLRLLGLPPYPNLAETIQATVDPESWERRGGSASVRMFGGKLVIHQTGENHGQIKRLLDSLAAPNPPPRVSAVAPKH